MTSRELVYDTLACKSPSRVPRMWGSLPCVERLYPEECRALRADFPGDITGVPVVYRDALPTKGDMFAVGKYVDEWGCTFENIQYGVIGEVKYPIIQDWDDLSKVHFPKEWLTLNTELVNRTCADTDKFVWSGFTPRPFEQLQFLRGTEDLYCDLMDPEPGFLRFLDDMHNLYCEAMEVWAKTDVDSLIMQDDWGSQQQLLIPPTVWRKIFLPMYTDYVKIAHSHGKKLHMHSDGNLIEILPDLISAGIDTLNLQVFCIGLDKLAPFAGKVTFVGEVDRQYLLAFATEEEVEQAVRDYHKALWKNGGTIAQLEFGPAGKPWLVRRALQTWDEISASL